MFKKVFGAAFLAVMITGSASAMSVGYTEGVRNLVAGTSPTIPTDSSSGPPGFDLGTLGFGATEFSQINIHGRIVGATDFFSFSANSRFRVEFIFGDIALDNGGTITGGFVQEGGTGNSSNFVLDLSGASQSMVFSTNITGGNPLIFNGIAGSPYTFSVQNGPNNNPSAAATYDIRLTAVPIPAALPLLVGGLGLLGYMGYRRKETTA
ncbi:hypothetical protein [uncultured Roseibium sp.]|uniref:hypothetical protein n=1 Tax=uncultured Roseibium sp. TaxID=1936171 RepID=UPI002604F51C|nr:hypothetical protein [uncultured Roseibium sp.]